MNQEEKETLQEIFYEPAKLLVKEMENRIDDLEIDQIILLEKLKFSLRMYELKQEQKRPKGGSGFRWA